MNKKLNHLNKGTLEYRNVLEVKKNIILVNKKVHKSPSRNARKIAAEVDMKRESVSRILKTKRRLNTYKISTLQQFYPVIRLQF